MKTISLLPIKIFYQDCKNRAEPYVSFRAFFVTFLVLLAGFIFLIQKTVMESSDLPSHPPTHEDSSSPFIFSNNIVAQIDLTKTETRSVPSSTHEEDLIPSKLHHDEEQHLALPAQKTEIIDGLFEETPFGAVPIKRISDGMSVFEAYKAPFIHQIGTKGIISIVLVDYGLSNDVSRQAVELLPPTISFALSPYADSIQHKLDIAKSSDHEIWMSIPFQDNDFALNDTGPLTILTGLNITQNKTRLLRILSLAQGYAGVVVTGNPSFEQDNKEGLIDIITEISNRGIGIANSSPSDHSIQNIAMQSKVPFVQNYFMIDSSGGELAFRQSLKNLEQAALEKYVTVAFMPIQPHSFSILKSWEAELSAKKLQLAPLSEAIRQTREN